MVYRQELNINWTEDENDNGFEDKILFIFTIFALTLNFYVPENYLRLIYWLILSEKHIKVWYIL